VPATKYDAKRLADRIGRDLDRPILGITQRALAGEALRRAGVVS
jgi:hypothetical protein